MEPSAPPRRVALFLDRDGVINRKAPEGDYVRSWADFEFLPGVVEALVELRRAGAELIVVTNQRGVARRMVGSDDLQELHRRMSARLAIAGAPLSGIYVCPHERDSCDCRKPRLGLFIEARRDLPWIDFRRSHLVGDSLSDLEAGWQLDMSLWLVGDEWRRAAVRQRAAERGIAIRGEGPSLAALVAGGGLLAGLQVESVGA